MPFLLTVSSFDLNQKASAFEAFLVRLYGKVVAHIYTIFTNSPMPRSEESFDILLG